MAEPFLAMITPVTGGAPTHPIAPGGPGVGIPTFPGQLPAPGGPVDPGYGVPAPPPTVGGGPIHPGHPEHPINKPPVGIWPSPGHPAHPIALPGGPVDPGYGVSGGRPVHLPAGTVLILVWIPGKGLEWIAVDTNLKPTHPIELPPPTVDPVPPDPNAPHPEHPIAPGGPAPAPTAKK